jgi:hypothetical protein
VAHVRFGSKAEVTPVNCDVCFTPESGRATAVEECPLSAGSGHFLPRKRSSIAPSLAELPRGISVELERIAPWPGRPENTILADVLDQSFVKSLGEIEF